MHMNALWWGSFTDASLYPLIPRKVSPLGNFLKIFVKTSISLLIMSIYHYLYLRWPFHLLLVLFHSLAWFDWWQFGNYPLSFSISLSHLFILFIRHRCYHRWHIKSVKYVGYLLSPPNWPQDEWLSFIDHSGKIRYYRIHFVAFWLQSTAILNWVGRWRSHTFIDRDLSLSLSLPFDHCIRAVFVCHHKRFNTPLVRKYGGVMITRVCFVVVVVVSFDVNAHDDRQSESSISLSLSLSLSLSHTHSSHIASSFFFLTISLQV